MKRVWGLLLLLLGMAAGAQADMQVFAAGGAMDKGMAQQLTALLQAAFPQEEWTLQVQGEETLFDLVMADRAPQLALCAPGEAMRWAEDGLLLDLTDAVGGQTQIEERVLSCCVSGERLFMAPLFARHRMMAVNRRMFEKERLNYLLDAHDYPSWYATQFHQILEEFMLSEIPAMEVWPPDEQTGSGIEALVQAIYGGELITDDGESRADSPEIRAGVKWLRDMIRSGMIGYVPDRETALRHFIAGETAIYIDWTEETQKKYAPQIEAAGLELMTTTYPSAAGDVARSFDLTAAAAFAGADAERNELAVKAAAFLHMDARAQRILGRRGIGRDDAMWLPSPPSGDRGTTMRRFFAGALRTVIEDGADADMTLETLQAAMDALN